MDAQRQKELDRLLAGGGMSGPALERALDGALQQAAPRARSRWVRPALWLAPAAAALLGVWLVRSPAPDGGGFRAKGEALALAPEVELVCGERTGNDLQCAHDAQLYFRVSGNAGAGYLSAVAEDATGQRVWFFPTASAPSVPLAGGPEPHLAPRSIKLAGVPAGQYRVSVWVSPRPLDREETAHLPTTLSASVVVLP